MRRYLHLIVAFAKMGWMADMEYRLNIVVRFLGELVWYVAQLSVFEVLYLHAPAISGWDVHAMRVFMGTLFLVDVLYMIFFHDNMDHIFQLVRKGELDLYLAKPVNSQFMVSFRHIRCSLVFNFLLVLGYLIWGVAHLSVPVTGLQVASFVVLLLSGLLCLYSFRFMFASLSVILQDAGNIHFVWYQLYRLATRPDPLYPSYLRLLVMTVLPMAFFASVPSRSLIEGFSWPLMASALFMSLTSFYVSTRWWKLALSRYVSASS